jgi:hypothetical protein
MTNNKNAIVMKTNYYNSRKLSVYSLFGLVAVIFTSCGSYQNKSYYDRDGIYGGESEKVAQTAANDGQAKVTESNKYTDYFNSLRDDQQDEVFTDVERYSTYNDTTASQNRNQSAAWGSNPSNVTVNVYDNNWGWNNAAWNSWNGWGWNNWGMGWNNWGWNSWYGPNWGMGWNNWGMGWNSWYGPNWGMGWNNWYGNGFYGNNYHNNYAYGNGRRGSTYGRPEGNSSRDYRRSSNTITRNTTVTGSRRTDYVPTRTTTTRNNTIRSNSYSPVRTYNGSNSTRNNSSNSTRTTTSPTRNNTYTPSNNSSNSTRSNNYSPSNSSSTRSSSGAGGGGSRSGGGGRR